MSDTETIDRLSRRVEELESENAELVKDRERLDWIEAQATGYGIGWTARQSTTGRGFRLHETSLGIWAEDGQREYAREAIDAAMKREGE